MTSRVAQAKSERLRAFAAGLPMATEEFPWGVRVAKANGRIFVFLGSAGSRKDVISVKLPVSFEAASTLGCSQPTRYGLGRSNWTTIDLNHAECPPVDLLEDWIEESYRAIAPTRLVAELGRCGASKVATTFAVPKAHVGPLPIHQRSFRSEERTTMQLQRRRRTGHCWCSLSLRRAERRCRRKRLPDRKSDRADRRRTCRADSGRIFEI